MLVSWTKQKKNNNKADSVSTNIQKEDTLVAAFAKTL